MESTSIGRSMSRESMFRVALAGLLGVAVLSMAYAGGTFALFFDSQGIEGHQISAGIWHIEVEIDVKPGSDPSSVNPNSGGSTPVAILSSEEFDAATVDPFSVCFGSEHDEHARSCMLDPNGGQPKLEDVTGNGHEDLVLHFRTRDTGIQHGDENACLTGVLHEEHGDIQISGCSDINTVGGGPRSQGSTTSSTDAPAADQPVDGPETTTNSQDQVNDADPADTPASSPSGESDPKEVEEEPSDLERDDDEQGADDE
jgi:hypothetical protein